MQRTSLAQPPPFGSLRIKSGHQLPWVMDVAAWTVALAVIGYPLAGLASTYLGVIDNTVSVTYRGLVVLLAVISFVINGLSRGVRGLDPMLSILLVLYTFRLLYDSGRNDLEGADLGLAYWTAGVLAPLLGIVLPRDSWNSRNIVTALFWVGFAACSASVLLSEWGLGVEEVKNRLVFEKLNPIATSHTALTTLLVIVAGRIYWQSRVLRTFSLAALPLTAYVMFLGNSRGAVVALMVCLSLLLLNRRLYFAVPIILLLLLVGLWFLPPIQDEDLLAYFRFSDLGVETSSADRLSLGAVAVDEFLDHPLLGSGYLLPGGSYPHNIFLESGVVLGVPGLCLIIALTWRTAVRAFRHVGSPQCIWALLFFQYLVGAQFSGNLLSQTAVFLFMAYFLSSAAGSAAPDTGEPRRREYDASVRS